MIPTIDSARFGLGAALLFVLGLAACFAVSARVRVRSAQWITLAAYVSHVVISIGVYATLGLFANDALAYDAEGVEIARRLGGATSATIQTSEGKEGWPWALGWIYHILGHHPALGLIVNAALAALIVAVVGLTCCQLGWSEAAPRAMWIVAFAPPMFIWATFLLREPAVNLTVAVALLAAARYLKVHRPFWIVVMCLVDLLLLWLRGPLSVLMLFGILLGIVLAGRLGTKRIRPRQAIVAVAILMVVIPLSVRLMSAFNISFSSINESRDALARTANTSFGAAVSSSNSPTGSLFLAVRQLPTAALGPFPWQYSFGLGGMLTTLDALTWAVFAAFLIRAWRVPLIRRGRWLCLTPAVVLLLSIALASGNFGTLVRIRAMAVPLLAGVIAVGMLHIPNRRRSRRHDSGQAAGPGASGLTRADPGGRRSRAAHSP